MKTNIFIGKHIIQTLMQQGMTYSEFKRWSESRLRKSLAEASGLTELEQRYRNYTRLNLQRMNRIEKTYSPPEALIQLVKKLPVPQYWMVLTEDWCGDSAQSLPYIQKIIAHQPGIYLRILRRDEHPEIMDRYLTEGKRSIPVLAAFNEQGEELFRWGPRPAVATRLVREWEEQGLPREKVKEQLHRWYAQNRGKEIEREFCQIMKTLVGEKVECEF